MDFKTIIKGLDDEARIYRANSPNKKLLNAAQSVFILLEDVKKTTDIMGDGTHKKALAEFIQHVEQAMEGK